MTRNQFSWLLGALAVVPLAQSATLTSGPASAASVLYSDSQLVQGSEASVAALQIPSAGNLFLSLTDLRFPDPFASLQFDLTGTQNALVGLSPSGTTLTLGLTGPATLYANVFATAQGPLDIGLYNLTATFLTTAPVSLPASGALLAGITSLALLLDGLLRRREQATVTTAMA